MANQKRQRKKAGRQAQQQAAAASRRRQSRRRTGVVVVVIVAIAALIAGVTGLFSGGGSSSNVASTGSSTTSPTGSTVKPGAKITGDTPCPKADGSSPRTTSFAKPPPMCIDPNKTYTATMQTSQGGPITIALDAKAAPKTVNNFVVLARYHFYDGVSFHRIVPDFVIQGGDPQGTGQGGPGYQFADELPAAGQYKLGSLAMANSGANTNGSQFFIITGSQGVQLPPQYSLFGQVTAGMDVVNKIAALGDPNAPNGEPKEPVNMTTVTIQES
jgi:cyclophilin family peptidyl-prolyl cis-trans isomerase